MALPIIEIPPIDGYGFTGPSRMMGNIGRTGNVVLDTPYGATGTPEFARWLYHGSAAVADVSYVSWDGTTQVLVRLEPGIWHPILSKMVNTAGTTAINLVWGS